MLISTGCCKAPGRQHVVRATCYLMKRVDGLSSSTVFRHCNCSIVDHHHTLVGQSRFADTAGVITRHCLLSITKKKKLYFSALCLHKPSQGLCWYSSRQGENTVSLSLCLQFGNTHFSHRPSYNS